ncbi:putative WD repeat-containing protein-like protein [Hapsidospora chrysogenum ATCC 11550]|uniref:Putative WD repeat-containing protein-like protein n=1 Tax=Hapsidospora chrysogenum (strain ATCC 11550 / CBS 779.69 / DSM 880 / IAM 14645 / JCM 23072 / IMI 49137) TaxID=857340 RepID=A0A086SZR9_HAPC1|nr:putative WD repeat-containing protein-like protein [Hapsidospora chrysogenum ATCC 11550]
MVTHVPSPVKHQGDGDPTKAPPGLALSSLPAGSEGGRDDQGSISDLPTPPNVRRSTTAQQSPSNTQNAKDKETKIQLRPTPSHHSSVGPDSLSTQIFLRTNSSNEPHQPSIAQRLRVPGIPESTSNTETAAGQTAETPKQPSNPVVDATREWRKGTSFLSRLSMRSRPWAKDNDVPDSDSELGELRDDGAHARAITSVVGAGGGYIPLHKEPPRYIRVKTRNKKTREFNRLFLAQELSIENPDNQEEDGHRAPATAVGRKILRGDSAAIWAAEFSLDGKYLAVGGKDCVVRVYAVISTPEDRKAQEEDEAQSGGNGEKLSAPVFRNKPVREFRGHTGEVLALSWSKNGFLLSSSMDKTVRLWLPSRPECLCTFQHSDIVTSVAFHPTDDRFFLAGCLDAQLRLWSIPDKSVPFSAETTEFITAVGFSPDGKTAICGVLSGMCTFYKTEGLESQFQIHVRSSRGKNAKGSKITGIATAAVDGGPDKGDVKLLISSNDSRVRVYSLNTRMLEAKFRGHVNQSSQIHARFAHDYRYIICGSEDQKAYIWGPATADAETRDKQPYECFEAHPEVVTTAVIAPTKSRQLLSASGDPIFDLCNPPPVKLVSLDESEAALSDGEPTERSKKDSSARKPGESPAYLERCKHHGGNIVVTTDRTGTIKIFRQDCAYTKRQQNIWETGSKFSGKLTGGVGRSGSVRTKASGTSRGHSRRGSLSIGHSPIPPQPSSDRIMSWRQGVDGSLRPSRNATPTRSERSMSPTKGRRSSVNASTVNLASESRKEPYLGSSVVHSTPASPTSSTHTNRTYGRLVKDKGGDQTPTVPPTPSFSLLSIADSREGKTEGGFWNLGRWKGGLSSKQPANPLSPSELADSPGRQSMGVAGSTRPRVNDGPQGRRVSSDARLTAENGKPLKGDAVRDDFPAAGKPRVDSGVGRLSAESAD